MSAATDSLKQALQDTEDAVVQLGSDQANLDTAQGGLTNAQGTFDQASVQLGKSRQAVLARKADLDSAFAAAFPPAPAPSP